MKVLTFTLLLVISACLAISHYEPSANALRPETVRYIYADGNQIHTTGISGFKGSRREIKEPGANAFLQGLEFDEKGDKPCFIRAHWWRYTAESIADANLPEDFTTFFNICNSSANGDQKIVFSSTEEQRQAVDSIRVCSNNNNNHRVKGVELTSAFVDRNGSGKVENNSGNKLQFDRTNCAPPWKATQTCPTGMAATGLVIEHSGEEITGLGLKCAKPLIKSVTIAENSATAANDRFSKMEKDIRVTVDKDGKTEKMTIREAVTRHEVNGVTVAVIDNGQVWTVRHYGIRSRKSNLPTNKDTLYQAASTSKFVAAIGMLIAAGKDHGPKLGRSAQATANANPGSLIDRWVDKQFKGDNSSMPKDITVERLLSHTAGLDTHGIGTARTNSKTDMENILLGQPLNPGVKPQSPPGLRYSYSGGGFVAAEAMLEIHSGRTATNFLNNDVLRPLGMTKSTFNTANDSMVNLARGCSRGVCSSEPEFTTVKFAGGLLANPEEYARLLVIILNNGKDASGRQVIPLADVQRLMTPAANIFSTNRACTSHSNCGTEKCYGGKCITPINADGDWYGLGVSLSDGGDFQGYPSDLYHGGAQDNAVAFFFLDRADGNGIVIMVNGESVWKKQNVEYGAEALKNDIKDAFFRYYP
ncbi:MAG TPA: serine hydrolase domain-containing protein [Pyrinomonadaceae bacterium]